MADETAATAADPAAAPSAQDKSPTVRQAPSTPTVEAATQAVAEPVHVNMDRGLGGRYVSLGGGERLFVPEETTGELGDGGEILHPLQTDDKVFYGDQ